MFTYIYLNVHECWLTFSMPQQRFKLRILINLITNSLHAWLTKDYMSSGMHVMCHDYDHSIFNMKLRVVRATLILNIV